MSLCDEIFINMTNEVLSNGTIVDSDHSRAVWKDTNEKATTKKIFGIVNQYDLRKEFPAFTLRKTYIKSAIDEILWIYQKKSNKISDLNSHIWDQWADENGTIGKAYGYQIGQTYLHHSSIISDFESLEKLHEKGWDGVYSYYSEKNTSKYHIIMKFKKDITKEDIEKNNYNGRLFLNRQTEKLVCKRNISKIEDIIKHKEEIDLSNTIFDFYMDQMDAVLYDLKHNPFSRRIIMHTYNFHDLHEMRLYPCAYSCTFNVTKENNALVLNMILNQRSQDILVAGNWNVVQYAALLMMVAQVSGMIPGKLIHVIGDAHIYDRHIPIIKEMIQRKTYPAPVVSLDPTITNFYDFTKDSFTIENYQYGEEIKDIPVAV